MTIKEKLIRQKSVIKKIARKHGAYDIRLFGSVARGEDKENSDIDLLVKTEEKTSPWFPGGLIAELEQLLGRKVDIVTEKGLNRIIRDRVFSDAIPL